MPFRMGYAFCLMIVALLLVGLPTVTAQIDEEPLFLFRGARPLGLGNAYEAIADDIYAIHYNPAGLAQIEEDIWQILLIRGRASNDFVDEVSTLNDFLTETIDPLTNSDDPLTDPLLKAEREALVNRAEKILVERHGLDVGFPSFGLVEPFTLAGYKAAVGISLYTQLFANARIVEVGLPWPDRVMEMLDNPVFYRVAFQGALATALAVKVPVNQSFLKDANFGLGFRLIRRGTFTDVEDAFAIKDVLDTDTFKERYFALEDDDNFADFARKNMDSKTGYSIDIGTLLFPIDGLRVGLAWRNVLSNITVEFADVNREEVKVDRVFPSNFVVAAAVKPLELMGEVNESLDVTLAASWDDPNGDDRLGDIELDSYTDHIHLGAEVVLWPKGTFSLGLRAGDNQGFVTYGVTLRLFQFLNLDIGRYGNLEADWWFASTEIFF